VIETPELDQQLSQARADLATAKANAALAKVTANRYQDLIGKKAVSQQDTDNAVSQLSARQAEVASADANVRRLEEMVSFERITAPFDGVVTARNLDIGQLVTASGSTDSPGSNTTAASRPIFEVAALGTLRVFIDVPQVHAPDARNGTIATLTLPQFPDRVFKGRLVRTSDSVDPATRTLLAEVDVDNRTGELLPGSYTEVHLHTTNSAPALVVPVGAVMLDPSGLHVAVVDNNQIAHIVKVTPGRDLGSTMQILGGLTADEAIITNPPDSLMDGEKVRVVSKPEQKPLPHAPENTK
jgi:RND family efflux transporter MFP subunit